MENETQAGSELSGGLGADLGDRVVFEFNAFIPNGKKAQITFAIPAKALGNTPNDFAQNYVLRLERLLIEELKKS